MDKVILSAKEAEKMTPESVYTVLQTNSNGLTEEEASQRLKIYGKNEIPEKEETLWKRIFRRFWGPIPWMIEIAAILSASVGKWEDFSIIVALLLLNAGMDLWQESKAINALKVLKNKLARTSTVLRDGVFKSISASDLVPGDIIKIKIGEIIPADVMLIRGAFLQVDQSALTGESLPVNKKTGDITYANAVCKQGEMLGVVISTGLNTFFGKTVSLVARAQKEERSHFQKMVIKVGNFLIVTTVIMAVIILLNGLYRGENMIEILRFTLVLTVAAIPVALPAVLTVTMAVGAMNLARKQAIVSRLTAIEELAGIDILCSDKTGTLTQNIMTISDPITLGNYTTDELMLYAGLASREENNDPIERPLFEYIRDHQLEEKLKAYKTENFVPFDPIGKRTEATLNYKGDTWIVTKGAPQVIANLCAPESARQVADIVESMAAKGYRTIGVAIKAPGQDMFTYVGLIPLYDPPREDAQSTINEARQLGIDVKMVTGDNIAIARQIALRLGLKDNILPVDSLKGKSDDAYKQLTHSIARAMYAKLKPEDSGEKARIFAEHISNQVKKELDGRPLDKEVIRKHESDMVRLIEKADGFAQVFPEDKYLIVDKLQNAGHIVAMTGDGVNDAPALKKADAGIAVSGATDAARAAADLVLLAPGISVVVDAIKQARVIFERMKSYAIFRIAETIRVILFMTLSILVFNFYPVTAIMIILLALLNDIPILTIAYDNTRIDEEPVRWNNGELFGLSTLLGVLGVVSSFLIFFILEKYTNLSQEMIQAIIFTKLVVAGHGTVYNTRTTDWFWKKPYPSLLFFGATFSTRVIGTIMAVYGIFVPAIGWGWGGFVWAYSLTWFLINDIIKVYWYRNFIADNKFIGWHFRRMLHKAINPINS